MSIAQTRTKATSAAASQERHPARDELAALRAALRSAGIDERRFSAVAIAAVRDARPSGIADPASQMAEHERRLLDAGGLDLSPRRSSEPDPVAATIARYAALLADSADVLEVSGRLGVTPARIRQRATERTLFAIREGEEWRFPRAQFDGDRQVRGLSAVVTALPEDLHPVDAWSFLTAASSDLELGDSLVSPLDWLRSGGAPEPVVALARDL